MPAIAHQNKILGNTSGGGSTILVTTSESTLYGQTVTLSDGTTTLTGTFSNAGECEFTGVMMVGTLTAASGTASTSINVPYFGVYSIILSLFSATITATYPEDKGATCTCTGNGESYTASGSPYTFTVHGAGEYRVIATLDGKSITYVIQITTDGQSETATINFGTIVVTYDNAFRGLPITCTKDSSVYTKTAPSSGNTMYFYPNITGNWVISGTVSGTPYSKTANVTSLSTSVSVSLETVPDGKTTTPTDDIEKWLQCGQITGKSYTTLSQVLADAETYERLLSDSNACDYMARSTTWAVATNVVPTMTSATTPSGEASASSNNGANLPYMAFDGTDTTLWHVNNVSAPAWLRYEFDTAVTIRKAMVKPLYYEYTGFNHVRIKTFKYQGSNDGSDWKDLTEVITANDGKTNVHSGTDSNAYVGVSTETEFTKNIGSYKYYQIYIIDTYGSNQYPAVCTLEFYSDADITTSQDAMMRLGKYDYACDALLADSTWCTAICGSTYFEYVLDVKVPTMTSNTTPSGTCIESGHYAGYEAYFAFDNEINSFWWSASGASNNYIGYIFTEPVAIKYLTFIADNTNSVPARTITIQASNDGFISDINDIATIECSASSTTENKALAITGDTKYTGWRLFCSDILFVSGSYYKTFKTIQFYGRHTAQTDIIVTAHGGDTVYYMENGSPVTLTTADSDTGIGTVDWSDLPKGAITLYSSTAKNPSDLTADYSKTVYITEYTTQIYLMPYEPVLYWFGHEDANLEDLSTTNGWSIAANHTFYAPTHNYTNIAINGGNGRTGGIGNKNAISGTTVHVIGITTRDGYTGDTNYLYIENNTSKHVDGGSNVILKQSAFNTLQYLSVAFTKPYLAVETFDDRDATIYAIWYE